MKLTVLTHTDGRRSRHLERCLASLENDLGEDIEHKVIGTRTYEVWKVKRLQDLLDVEYGVFVDDDDEIVPGALRQAWEVMKANPETGVVFTDEITVTPNGARYTSQRPRTYEEVPTCPRVIHHLALMNTRHIDRSLPRVLEETDGVGVDWLMKSTAAFNGGALYLPVNGYLWRRNTPIGVDGNSRMRYVGHLPKLRQTVEIFRSQRGATGLIPHFQPKEKL